MASHEFNGGEAFHLWQRRVQARPDRGVVAQTLGSRNDNPAIFGVEVADRFVRQAASKVGRLPEALTQGL